MQIIALELVKKNMFVAIIAGGMRDGEDFMTASETVSKIKEKSDEVTPSDLGTKFEVLVGYLSNEVRLRTKQKIKNLNGSGTPLYDPADPLFEHSVVMVAEDIANLILRKKLDLASEFLEYSPNDVLAEQAHLVLDY